MDLLDTWKKLEEQRLKRPVAGSVRPPSRSSHPVSKLKRNYFVKMAFSFLFLLISVELLFIFDDLYIRVGMALVTCAYVIFLVSAWTTYRKIKVDLPIDGSLKVALLYTIDIIETNLKFEERAALVVYPFAVASGFLMGLTAGGEKASRVFSEPFFGVVLIISILVLTPLCYLVARWMNKVSYGKCISEMKAMVADLESGL